MDYAEVIKEVSKTIEIKEGDLKKLEGNKHFELMTMMPFLIGSEDPDRYAVSILTVLLSALKCGKYKARKTDFESIFELDRRLRPVFNMHDKGNVDKLANIRNLIILVMLADMKLDKTKDRIAGKYNPFNTDVNNTYDTIMEDLVNAVRSYPDIDAILTPEVAVNSWWW